jgi:hypothetical protein
MRRPTQETLRTGNVTPPPSYDENFSPTSGLADYFARLSEANDDSDG